MLGRIEYKPTPAKFLTVERHFGRRSVERLLGIRDHSDVLPSDSIPIIRRQLDQSAEVIAARWGAIMRDAPAPAANSSVANLFAAEPAIEAAPGHPVWGTAMANARCLIPATGWYRCLPRIDEATGEPVVDPETRAVAKRRFALRNPRQQMVSFAGVYRTRSIGGNTQLSATILMRAAPPELAWLHEYVPCVLPESLWSSWLNPTLVEPDAISQILDRAQHEFDVSETAWCR